MNIFLIVIYILCGIYMLLNFKYDIQMLQQNSYRTERYWKWQKERLWTGWRMTDVAMIFLLLSTLLDMRLCLMIVTAVCLWKTVVILKKRYKKPLVFTKRVWRIYTVTGVIGLCGYLASIISFGRGSEMVSYYHGPSVVISILLLITTFSWLPVILAVLLLTPVEKHINSGFRKDAVRILKSMPDLKVIGITGSYGKTSTKHYLHTILSEKYETLMTPGSYNTPMGVIRTIREMMKPYTEIFICEMGAKQIGDIKEICDIVAPHNGIITAVGPMHLETFKNIENVAKTKFELADALPKEGLVVVNNDFEAATNRRVENCRCIRYGITNTKGCEYVAENIVYSPEGTVFEIVHKKDEKETGRVSYRTRLVGECNISNLMAAIIMARYIGMDEESIARGMSRIEQVEHRLSVKRTPGGITIIDDAFNSNPTGSKMALEVLGAFQGGKRIVVTPGMIELGEKQEILNRELGVQIGRNADVAVIVNEINRDALVQGISDSDNEIILHTVGSFAEAQQLLNGLIQAGDIVLYENDLPDTFK